MRLLSVCSLFACSLLVGLLPLVASAQAQTSVTPFAGGAYQDALPFWLTANRDGRIARSGPQAGLLATGVQRGQVGALGYEVGAQLLARAGDPATLTAHELYGRLTWHTLFLEAGRRARPYGLADTTRTLGTITRSRNAPPMPQISAGSQTFLDVPGTNGYLGVKGFYSHGWFENGRFVEDVLLHEKYLYLRLLPADFPVRGYAGILHHAMWSGTSPIRGELVSNWEAYWDVVFGKRTDGETNPADTTEGNSNQLGAYDFRLSVDLRGWQAMAYRQFYIEDEPGTVFRNAWDGLWGVGLHRAEPGRLIDAVLYEHVAMLRQGSKYDLDEPRGADNYYNHSTYWSGWTYRGRTLGVPLLFTDGERFGVLNNLVAGHHLAVEGTLPRELRYRAFATYSRNYGARAVFAEPADAIDDLSQARRVSGRTPRRDQFSGLLELTAPLLPARGLSGTLALALDYGDVYPDNVGALLALTWRPNR